MSAAHREPQVIYVPPPLRQRKGIEIVPRESSDNYNYENCAIALQLRAYQDDPFVVRRTFEQEAITIPIVSTVGAGGIQLDEIPETWEDEMVGGEEEGGNGRSRRHHRRKKYRPPPKKETPPELRDATQPLVNRDMERMVSYRVAPPGSRVLSLDSIEVAAQATSAVATTPQRVARGGDVPTSKAQPVVKERDRQVQKDGDSSPERNIHPRVKFAEVGVEKPEDGKKILWKLGGKNGEFKKMLRSARKGENPNSAVASTSFRSAGSDVGAPTQHLDVPTAKARLSLRSGGAGVAGDRTGKSDQTKNSDIAEEGMSSAEVEGATRVLLALSDTLHERCNVSQQNPHKPDQDDSCHPEDYFVDLEEKASVPPAGPPSYQQHQQKGAAYTPRRYSTSPRRAYACPPNFRKIDRLPWQTNSGHNMATGDEVSFTREIGSSCGTATSCSNGWKTVNSNGNAVTALSTPNNSVPPAPLTAPCSAPQRISNSPVTPPMVEKHHPSMGDAPSHQRKEPANLDLTKYEHILELYDFPPDMHSDDLFVEFNGFVRSGFDIKWVDDTHCLAVFATKEHAERALLENTGLLTRVRRVAEASVASKWKLARAPGDWMQPFKARPETSNLTARRLINHHLGIKNNITPGERRQEERKLQDAKNRRSQRAKADDDAWNGNFG